MPAGILRFNKQCQDLDGPEIKGKAKGSLVGQELQMIFLDLYCLPLDEKKQGFSG